MPEPDTSATDAGARLPARRVLFEEKVAVLCMAALVVITLLNVITRYLTDQSFAWTEEISIVLMVVMTLAGAAAAAGRDAHVRIEVLYDGGSAKRRRALRLFSAARHHAGRSCCSRCCSRAWWPTRCAGPKPRWASACRAGGSPRPRRSDGGGRAAFAAVGFARLASASGVGLMCRLSTTYAGKAAGGYAPALGCGSPSLREGFPAVRSLMARRETRFTPCGRCAQTS